MYNRYVRNDNGSYSRISQNDAASPKPTHSQPEGKKDTNTSPKQAPPQPPPPTSTMPGKDGLTGILRHFLDQFHLDSVDTGDLLLLGLLFFLFRENADDELLAALGLLLIL